MKSIPEQRLFRPISRAVKGGFLFYLFLGVIVFNDQNDEFSK
jgi:hypothetical protein